MVPMKVLAAAIGLVLGSPLHPTHAISGGGAWTPALWFLASEQGVWYDPSDLTAEKQAFRRNLTQYTESLGEAGVTATYAPNVTYQQNARLAPNGQMAMDKIIPTAVDGAHGYGPLGYTPTPGAIYTMSVYVAYGGIQYVSLKPDNNWNPVAVFDLINGVIVSQSPSVTNVSIEALPDGIYRIAVSGVPDSGVDRYSFLALQDGPVYQSWTGNGTDGVYAWGFQIEKGNVATAYQPIPSTYETLFLSQYPNHTMFQDSVGTTPVTAVEQPVGLILDKRLGLVRGSELVTNGDFSNGLTGWSTYDAAVFTVVGGVLTATSSASSNYIGGQSGTTAVVGKSYELTWTVISSNQNNALSFGGITTPYVNITGQRRAIVTAISTETLQIYVGGATGSIEIDNISVRELPGNHASQATAASRPVLSARKNLLTHTEQYAEYDVAATSYASLTHNAATSEGVNLTHVVPSTGDSQKGGYFSSASIPVGDSVFQFIAKAGAMRYVQIYDAGNATLGDLVIDAQTGAITQNSGALSVSTAVRSDGSYSVTLTNVGRGTSATFGIQPVPTATVSGPYGLTYTGDGTSGMYFGGMHLEAGTSIARYQRVNTATEYDSVGFPHYLKLDGVDDFLSTGNIDFTGTDKMTVVAGVRKLSDVVYKMIVELSPNVGAYAGSFALLQTSGFQVDSPPAYGLGLCGTSSIEVDLLSYASPHSGVLAVNFDIGGALQASEMYARVNGATPSYTFNGAGTSGSGNFGTYPLYIGARGGVSLHSNIHLYQLIVRGAATADLAPIEAFTADKTGVTL